jgi:hypothetical protein
MARLPFEEIKLSYQTRPSNKQILKPKLHNGLDTETLNGYVRLLCDDSNVTDRSLKSYNPPLLITDGSKGFQQILEYLTKPKFQHCFNWFYNIQYDFESFVKYLSTSDLQELYTEGSIDYAITKKSANQSLELVYHIEYMKRKYFGISIIGSKDYYHYYDLFNFMDVSLNKASKKYLNEQKNDDVDSSRLNLDLNYWNENQEKIIKYCIQDSFLTMKLANKFWKIMYDNLNLIPKRPFSKGKLSEEYFLKTCNIPTINNLITRDGRKILEFAYKSFYGGRFELVKRGYFEKVYCYDIKSAYPAQMAQLIDMSIDKGTWKETKNKISPDAFEGWYRVIIKSNEVNFAPIVYKINNINIYPNGKFNQYLLKSEIEFIRENFDNVEIKIISGVEFFPKEYVYPFKIEVEKLYKWKDKETDDDIKHVVKIILNSIYGKTIQVSQNETNEIGNLFNPMYASMITSKTRMKLLELALQKPETVIMFSTDGLHTTEELKTPAYPKLGEFAKDFVGEGVYLMSDVYNIWTDKQVKNKIRGFNAGSTKDLDSETVYLKDILEKMKGKTYQYTSNRPVHLGEALIHNKKYTKENINVWEEINREININGDAKRIWDNEFKSGKDCLKRNINSLPHEVGVD